METPTTLNDLLVMLQKFLQFKLFELNNTPVTISSVIIFVFAVFVLSLTARFIERVIVRRILVNTSLEVGIRYTLGRILHYLIMGIGILIVFQIVGLDLGALAVIFGLLSVGIGFGLQNITSNFVAGLILLFERPIKVGDRVTVGDVEGDVIAINMRSSTINSINNISIIVPNSEFISSRVINWSHGDRKIRLDLEVGVSYESDLDLVLTTLKSVADRHPKVLGYPEADVMLVSFGDSAWNMRLRVWIPEATEYPKIRSELNQAIVRSFREHGIEIPYPQRDLHVRSPLPVPLRQDAPEGSA